MTDMDFIEPVKYRALHRLYADMDYSPLYETHEETFESKPGDSSSKTTNRAEIRCVSGVLECKAESNGKVTKKTVPIPKGTDLKPYIRFTLDDARPPIGEKQVVTTIDWHKLALAKSTIYVGQRAKVKLKSDTIEATPVCEDDGTSITTDWYLDDGKHVKTEDSGQPITGLDEPREEATRGFATTEDYETVKSDRDILESAKSVLEYQGLTELAIGLVGVKDGSFAVNDARQSAKFVAGENTIEYDITAKHYDSSKVAKIPITDSTYAAWLAGSASVQSGDARIRTQAQAIIGTETDAYKAACKLRAWVYDNMDTESGTETPLSAVDILAAKLGDCKHCALLCAALARSVGIPTRVVIGLVYGGDKEFWGHAWVECFVGEWVTLDPTSPFDFANALYIKMGDGDDLLRANQLPRAGETHIKVNYVKFSNPVPAVSAGTKK